MESVLKIVIHKPANLTDSEIVTEVLNGNTRQYEEIMRRYNQRLYRIARGMGISDDQCEDMLQETYISAYRSIENYRNEAAFSTWLTRILINCCLMHKRKNGRVMQLPLSEYEKAEPSSYEDSPEPILLRKEITKLIEKGISNLAEKQRIVYMMREAEGLSVKETAEALNYTEANVKVQLHRAKARLRTYLEKQLGENDVFTFGNERCDRVVKYVLMQIERPLYC